MLYLTVRALVSGVIIAIASEVAKRSPGVGALILSLPLIQFSPSSGYGATLPIKTVSRRCRNRPSGSFCRRYPCF